MERRTLGIFERPTGDHKEEGILGELARAEEAPGEENKERKATSASARPAVGPSSSTCPIPRRGSGRGSGTRFSGGKREAQKECARLVAEMDAGSYVEPAKVTVSRLHGPMAGAHALAGVSADPGAV